MEEYQVSLTKRERIVIKNLLEKQIECFQEEIEHMKDLRTDLCTYDMDMAKRREWIKNYRGLIKKLYNKED